ncbi:hypothetical protein IE077_000546 [Cardiosporidium cionae]|uniref:Small ribosomal subunit protein uS10 domain-containing protein n=1 Tax=Cardiosporidium cionae TaxID=476202 RepID=A0ABQ7J885_9APIC|nr:hypothetical protein IE077_000546 [Cardiosporidium cionae]|eukprot:KAF8820209.1 hypothetical protein IE077_000546 [Cardiosporidium cionae]
MSALDYSLAWLKVVYTARQTSHLHTTVTNLRRILETASLPLPVPCRLPRRQWRVTYLKSPFKHKHSIRHYVFNDFRYAFTFYDVKNPQLCMSAVLGALSAQTGCACNFAWRFPGTGNPPLSAENALKSDSLHCEQHETPQVKSSRIYNYRKEERAIARISANVEKKNLHWFINKNKNSHV